MIFRMGTRRRGMTLAELVISLAIMFAFLSIFTLGFLKQRGRSALDVTVRKAATLLREAQARSVAREKGMLWGVHFENAAGGIRPFYALFALPYNPSSVVDRQSLPPSVSYAASSIPAGSAVEAIFSSGTGIPLIPRTIVFELYDNLTLATTTSLTVTGEGLVTY